MECTRGDIKNIVICSVFRSTGAVVFVFVRGPRVVQYYLSSRIHVRRFELSSVLQNLKNNRIVYC